MIITNIYEKNVYHLLGTNMGLCPWLSSKESACSAAGAGDVSLIFSLERSPGGVHGYSLQYSYLRNSMDRGAWWVTVHGVAKSWTWLSDWHYHFGKYGLPYGIIRSLETVSLSQALCRKKYWAIRPKQATQRGMGNDLTLVLCMERWLTASLTLGSPRHVLAQLKSWSNPREFDWQGSL